VRFVSPELLYCLLAVPVLLTVRLMRDRGCGSGGRIRFSAVGQVAGIAATATLMLKRSLPAVFRLLASRQLNDEHLPTQDDVIQLLSRLHNADVILGGVKPDSDEMVHRQQTLRKKKVRSYFINPLGLRFPLLDPESMLLHMQGTARVLFNPFSALLWLLLIVLCLK